MANKINNIPQHKTVVNTPATPDLGFGRIYIKSDNQWYGLDDGGVETQLGGGSGGGINLTSLSANAPITYNNTNGTFSIAQSNGSTNGYLSSTDWTAFNSKQGALTLTTTGSSGAATLVGSTLNIPQYSGGSGGGVAGAGTLNYLTKWTPDGTTLGNSAIVEDANGYIGIATPVVTSIKVNIKSTSTYGVRILTSNSNLNGANYGLVAEGSKVGSNFDNTGVWGQAQGSTAENRGIHGTATTGNSLYASKQYAGVFEAYNGDPATPAHAGSIAVGIYVTASNKWGGSAYFARFEKYLGDPLNKVVLSDNIYGYADWGKVTSSYTTGATGTFTSADSKTITVNNGLITSIV